MCCNLCHFLPLFLFTVKPYFNKEPSDITVLTGETVQFHCSVSGDPQPKILWRKDDGNMPVGRADIKEEDKSLIIKNVIPADEGIYICEAHNSVGQINAKAQLVVNCKCCCFLVFLFFVFCFSQQFPDQESLVGRQPMVDEKWKIISNFRIYQ